MVGFVYEADRDALKDAQENMNDEIYELIKNQLETTKELSNIYDTMGNQLMSVQDTLSQIDFTKYYNSISGNTDNSWLLSSLLNSINMQDIISQSAAGNVSIDISGMTLNGVNSVEDLGDAIVTQLPSYLLQYLYSKDTVTV